MEAVRQAMQQKTADELVGIKRWSCRFAESFQVKQTLPSDPTSTLSRLFWQVRARKQLILADLF